MGKLSHLTIVNVEKKFEETNNHLACNITVTAEERKDSGQRVVDEDVNPEDVRDLLRVKRPSLSLSIMQELRNQAKGRTHSNSWSLIVVTH